MALPTEMAAKLAAAEPAVAAHGATLAVAAALAAAGVAAEVGVAAVVAEGYPGIFRAHWIMQFTKLGIPRSRRYDGRIYGQRYCRQGLPYCITDANRSVSPGGVNPSPPGPTAGARRY